MECSRKRKLYSGVQLRKLKNDGPLQKKRRLVEGDWNHWLLENQSFYNTMANMDITTDGNMDEAVMSNNDHGSRDKNDKFASSDKIEIDIVIRFCWFFFPSWLLSIVFKSKNIPRGPIIPS